MAPTGIRDVQGPILIIGATEQYFTSYVGKYSKKKKNLMENTGESLGRNERRNSYRDLHCKPERLAMVDWWRSTSVFS